MYVVDPAEGAICDGPSPEGIEGFASEGAERPGPPNLELKTHSLVSLSHKYPILIRVAESRQSDGFVLKICSPFKSIPICSKSLLKINGKHKDFFLDS